MGQEPTKSLPSERARAILKVSQGETIQATAEKLRVRVHRDAVSEWVQRFLADGLEMFYTGYLTPWRELIELVIICEYFRVNTPISF
jgi:hypothetical protein